MTSHSTDSRRGDGGVTFESIDPDTASRIDAFLERALDADDPSQKDFHVRHARQVLEACTQ
jgi:hypothetical protein